jgi:hypothetical protein
MIVIDTRNKADSCSLYTRLSDSLVSKYVLKGFTWSKDNSPISISRCTDSLETFLPKVFRITKPSPNAVNHCSGENSHV